MRIRVLCCFVGTLLLSCDSFPSRRYELVPGGGTVGNLVYRLDRETGAVCAFRWWPSRESRHQDDPGQTEGFQLVGCSQ